MPQKDLLGMRRIHIFIEKKIYLDSYHRHDKCSFWNIIFKAERG